MAFCTVCTLAGGVGALALFTVNEVRSPRQAPPVVQTAVNVYTPEAAGSVTLTGFDPDVAKNVVDGPAAIPYCNVPVTQASVPTTEPKQVGLKPVLVTTLG